MGYIPSFIEPYKRISDAAVQLVQEAYIKGVSTRKINAVVKAHALRASRQGKRAQPANGFKRHG